jgi:hypothetical protein
MWGFTPDYFDYSEKQFVAFLVENQNNPKAEFYIPSVVNHLIESRRAEVKVLDTPSRWFGVTYAEDRPAVVSKINGLVDNGTYPSRLF